MPKMPFNTKDTFRNLAGQYFGAKKSLNKMIAKMTIIYANFGGQNMKWDDLLDAGKSIVMPVHDLLDRLQAATTQQAKTAFERLFNEAKPLLERSMNLETTAGDVRKINQQSQTEALDLMKPAWQAKDPSKPENVDRINKAEAICNKNAEELERQEKSRVTVDLPLKDIEWQIYLALPDKSGIPRSSITPSLRQKLGSSGG
jgi:hypothetical protein